MLNKGIPISVSLDQQGNTLPKKQYDRKRLFRLSALAILIGVWISVIAKVLVYLIDKVSAKSRIKLNLK